MEKTNLKTASDGALRPALKPAMKRAGEALFFAGVILLSSLAVITVAIAAPFVLAASAIVGAFASNKDAQGWRPVSA